MRSTPSPTALPGRASGFTLVELLVAITIMAILAAAAVPSMGDWIRNNRIKASAQEVYSLLQWARSEAITQNSIAKAELDPAGFLNLCSVKSMTDQCSDKTLIGTMNWNPSQLTLASNSQIRAMAAFDSRGRSLQRGSVITITLCDDRAESNGMVITISPVGRPRLKPLDTALGEQCL